MVILKDISVLIERLRAPHVLPYTQLAALRHECADALDAFRKAWEIEELRKLVDTQHETIFKLNTRIAEMEAENNCCIMLSLCGEEGGLRPGEQPAHFLRRLIDALIKSKTAIRQLTQEPLVNFKVVDPNGDPIEGES